MFSEKQKFSATFRRKIFEFAPERFYKIRKCPLLIFYLVCNFPIIKRYGKLLLIIISLEYYRKTAVTF